MSFTPQSFAVWFEIPVTDMDKSIDFYNAVFEIALKKDNSGPNPMAIFEVSDQENGTSGHLYPGKPASKGDGITVHLASPGKLEDTLARVKKAGGEVISDIISIPSGQFAYCLDLDGNSIGIFSR